MVVPLLRKRFKQRNERHLIEHFGCRLKQNGYGDPGITLVSKLWGEATRNLAFKIGFRLASANAPHYVRVVGRESTTV